MELVRQEDWEAITGFENPTLEQIRLYGAPYDCWLYGGLRPDGSVAWFDVAEYMAGDQTAEILRRPVAISAGLIVVDGGLGLAVGDNVEVTCNVADTADSFDDWVAGFEDMASRTIVDIDVGSGEVSGLSCYFEF